MTSKIVKAQTAVQNSRVLENLRAYSPELVSTIFVGLDTHTSDIDIVCTYQEQATFISDMDSIYGMFQSYSLCSRIDHAVARFIYDSFLFEVYASSTPVKLQNAYRHYRVMQRLVGAGGKPFQEAVRKLKERGLNTEPAIGQLLGLPGDPYAAVLQIERWSEDELQHHVQKCICSGHYSAPYSLP